MRLTHGVVTRVSSDHAKSLGEQIRSITHSRDRPGIVQFQYKMPLLQQPNCQRSPRQNARQTKATASRVCLWTEAESNASLKPASGHSYPFPLATGHSSVLCWRRYRCAAPETGNLTRQTRCVKSNSAPADCRPRPALKLRSQSIDRSRRQPLSSRHRAIAKGPAAAPRKTLLGQALANRPSHHAVCHTGRTLDFTARPRLRKSRQRPPTPPCTRAQKESTAVGAVPSDFQLFAIPPRPACATVRGLVTTPSRLRPGTSCRNRNSSRHSGCRT